MYNRHFVHIWNLFLALLNALQYRQIVFLGCLGKFDGQWVPHYPVYINLIIFIKGSRMFFYLLKAVFWGRGCKFCINRHLYSRCWEPSFSVTWCTLLPQPVCSLTFIFMVSSLQFTLYTHVVVLWRHVIVTSLLPLTLHMHCMHMRVRASFSCVFCACIMQLLL